MGVATWIQRHLHYLFVLTCMYGLEGRYLCGPLELCSCDNLSGTVRIDCSNVPVRLQDVCNYTGIHSDISEIVFNVNNVSILKEKDMIGCEHVEKLHLRNSSITRVDNGVFLNMNDLTILDLSWNNLDMYNADYHGYLHNQTSLKELRLQGNLKDESITGVSYPFLSNLQQLEVLFLDGIYNTEFNGNYKKLHKLSHLDMSGTDGTCNLGELTNFTFTALPQLKTMDLSDCNITNIHAGTFAIVHNLTWLDLSLNKLIGFTTMRNVSYGLQFTNIDFLNISMVHNLFGLGTEMRRRDFCYLRNTSLRELALDGNCLRFAEPNLVLLLPRTLQVIYARDNMLTFGIYLLQLACLSNLTTIHAGYQNAAHTPRQYLENQKTGAGLIMHENSDCPFENSDYLFNLSKSIKSCHYFKSDQITSKDLYNASFPATLTNISLRDSTVNDKLTRYRVFPIYNTIETIDMSGNIFYSWDGPIGPFPLAKSLDLSRNYCSYVSSIFFSYFASLQFLYIGQNSLGIPLAHDTQGEIFKSLKSLTVLDLSSNQIRQLPSNVFIHLDQLQRLNLSFNTIDTWTIDVQALRRLNYLDIRSNALSTLPQSLMSHFDKMNKQFKIDMRNNPIKCSCQHELFLRWMVNHQSAFIAFETYNFTDDSDTQMTASACIKLVQNFTKTCGQFTYVIIVCSVGITLFISLVICGLIYKNRWKLRYYLYMNKRRFYGYQAIPDYEPIDNFKFDAFISYAEENIRFILDGIIPNLERKGLSICIHQRDFMAGNAVTDNIINAIQSSRKTVIILSKAFLKSKWCLYEFHMSRMESIYSRDGNSSVIIVMLESMPPNKLMPLEMIEWIKHESYIEYTVDEQGTVLFWDKLKDGILH